MGKKDDAMKLDKSGRKVSLNITRVATPNDLKLSDGRAGHDPCMTPRADENCTKSAATRSGESTGHDAPARSLERMVRRFGDFVLDIPTGWRLEAVGKAGLHLLPIGKELTDTDLLLSAPNPKSQNPFRDSLPLRHAPEPS